MPNGHNLSNNQIVELEKPLKETDVILKDFAGRYKFNYSSANPHDYPNRSLSCKIISKTRKYYIGKHINITLENEKEPYTYKFWLSVSNTYGLREFIQLFPILRTKFNISHKRLGWEKILTYLEAPIDKEKLSSSLIQAKQLLDNFDESQLQEIK